MRPLVYAVDDLAPDRSLYECMLGATYDLRVFANYTDCLAAIATHPPAVVLCDLILPDMNGWTGILVIQKEYPGIQCIVATCLDSPIQQGLADIKGLKFWPKSDFKLLKALIDECLGAANGR
jgi:DNA-binding NtrC family response regulator